MRTALRNGIIVMIAVTCSAQVPEAQRPDSLLVAPFATDIKYVAPSSKDHTPAQLSYWVEESYPATDTLAFIRDRLKQKGWKPLNYDFLNPSLPSSHSRGWTNFVDASGQTEQRVYLWMAQWENEKQELVSYYLRYRFPEASNTQSLSRPEMNHLQVIAIFMPKKVAPESNTKTHFQTH